MPQSRSSRCLAALLATLAFAATGCSSRYFASEPALAEPSGAVLAREASAPRALFMFEGSTGRTLGWSDVMAAASWADAVFIGERHDDPAAHAVQLAIYEDLVSGYPGTALALEHLERNEQADVDRYLRGETSPDAFIDATKSRDWAGKDTWVRFFQPLVDCARENEAPVVAANAPRDVVRRARSEGHAALDALPAPERATFEIPIVEQGSIASQLSDDWNGRWNAYQARFRAIMAPAGEDPDAGETRTRLDSLFLSQSVWDATMGASAAAALERGAPKVVLCAGCFHVERDGGTVLQFEARRPRARVLTVTVIDDSSDRLRDADRGAADIVIYGFPVARAKPEAEMPEDDTPEAEAPAPEAPVAE
ncbi:MAG: ChaN family lipoprotein [Planctomycetota bacterium]